MKDLNSMLGSLCFILWEAVIGDISMKFSPISYWIIDMGGKGEKIKDGAIYLTLNKWGNVQWMEIWKLRGWVERAVCMNNTFIEISQLVKYPQLIF